MTNLINYYNFSNAIRRTPLHCAAFYGYARVIELLIVFKADLDAKDKLKTTPLQLAAKEGHVTAVEILLEHHASMTSLDQHNFNALDWAIENGHRYDMHAFHSCQQWIAWHLKCIPIQRKYISDQIMLIPITYTTVLLYMQITLCSM